MSKMGQPMVVFVYVSGHGVLINHETHLVCPVSPTDVEVLNMENLVQQIAQAANTHVYALFDCCRDEESYKQVQNRGVTMPEIRGYKHLTNPGTTSILFVCKKGRVTFNASKGVSPKTDFVLNFIK